MILRQLPGLASLGLLTALLAHVASYGGSHEVGGVYHTTLLLAAIGGTGAFIAACATLAVVGLRRHGDGSILAAALRPALPGAGGLTLAGSLWFTLIESLEPHHAMASPAIVGVALILCAAFVAAAARRAVDSIAGIVFRIIAAPHRRRTAFVPFFFAPVPSARAVAFAYRRFARPPPL